MSNDLIKLLENDNNIYNEIFNKTRSFILKKENRYLIESKIKFQFNKIYNIELEDLKFINISIEDREEDSVRLHLIVESSVLFNYTYGRYNDREISSINDIWLLFYIDAEINQSIIFTKVHYPINYNKYKKEMPLDKDLIPVIRIHEYDLIAEKILEKYYKEALEKPMQINPYFLAKNMKIKIMERAISKDKSIFGQLYFNDYAAILYNDNDDKNEVVNIESNTIVIDNNALGTYSYGCKNITVAHELSHFLLHKKTINFYNLFNDSINIIQCNNNGRLINEKKKQLNIKMEMQANILAPCLLMPKRTFIDKLKELINKYEEKNILPIDYIEDLIKELSDFFNVTIYAVRKRMIDLNYLIAFGAFNYVDNNYVKPYIFNNELEKDETYVISFEKYNDLLNKDNSLFINILSGALIFVDNHIVLNNSKYIEVKDDRLVLTKYARLNIDECAVVFKCKYINNFSKIESSYLLCRNKIDLMYDITFSRMEHLNDELILKYNEAEKNVKEAIEFSYNKNFNEILKYLMNRMEIEKKELAIDSGLNIKTIDRYLKGERIPDKRCLISICIGLKIHYGIIRILLDKCQVAFFNNREDEILQNVLLHHRLRPIKEINKWLTNLNIKPLNSK